MPKRSSKKKAAGKKSQPAAKHPPNAPLTEEQEASIWTHYEETGIQREVARRLNIAPSTVSKVLARNPLRLEALRARHREERSQRWRNIETKALAELEASVDRVAQIMAKGRMSKRDHERIAVLPRLLTGLRLAGESSTKAVNLLTGGPTDRIEGQSTEDMNAEQLIRAAKRFGMVGELPAELREYAEANGIDLDAEEQ